MKRRLMALLGALPLLAAAQPLDFLHWWTAGSEAQTLAELRQTAHAAGVAWQESPVAGAVNANTLLKTRFLSGNPPALAQIDKAVSVWGEAVPLADLSPVAQGWRQVLPPVIAAELQHRGRTVAVPINVHRLNTLWSNLALLQRHGLEVPRTWGAFFAAGDRLKAAGVIPLAIGGSVGQKFSVFADVVLGQGGPQFFRRALVQGDAALLAGPEMLQMLRDFKRVKAYTDAGQAGRDWSVATGLVIQGRAAMQLTGDWANGEFLKAGRVAGRDYDCTPAPGHGALHYFEFDRLLFFRPASAAGNRSAPARRGADAAGRFDPLCPHQGRHTGACRCRSGRLQHLRAAFAPGLQGRQRRWQPHARFRRTAARGHARRLPRCDFGLLGQ